jgi:hypothetical protein
VLSGNVLVDWVLVVSLLVVKGKLFVWILLRWSFLVRHFPVVSLVGHFLHGSLLGWILIPFRRSARCPSRRVIGLLGR